MILDYFDVLILKKKINTFFSKNYFKKQLLSAFYILKYPLRAYLFLCFKRAFKII